MIQATTRAAFLCIVFLFFAIPLLAQPANDDCANATTLTIGSSSSATVRNATASGNPTVCAGNPDDDVWFQFTAVQSSALISLSSIGGGLTTSGLIVQLYSGTSCALTHMQCNTANNGFTATGLTIGNSYYLRAYSAGTGAIGGGASQSAFTILVSATPSNDECVNSILIPTATTCFNSKGTLSGATTSTGIPMGSCTGTPDDDVWYHFVATKTNPTISLSNLVNISSPQLQLFSGSCGSLTSIACGTNSISGLSLTIGNTYYLRVYSAGSTPLSSATYYVCVTDPMPVVVTDSTTALFTVDTVAMQLGYPWEVTYGPDDSLWVTEARGYRVLRVSSSRTGANMSIAPQQVLKVPLGGSQVNFDRTIGTWPQGGMQGLAIHPEFMTNPSKRWVYLSYVYNGSCVSGPSSPCIFRTKIVRCRFYFSSDAGNPALPLKDTLVIMDTVISNLPGSNDHNSGRMKIGPVLEGPDNTYKLYYTIGDMGASQFNNLSRSNNAQNKDTCEGKVLRLNTELATDGTPGSPVHDFDKWRAWIPNENPYTHSILTSVRTPIYSYGHRNAQGIAWGNVNGTWPLYSSEHGDRSDDEVNIIESGKNYGWPNVTGLADDNYNTGDNSTDGFTLNDVLAGQTITNETTFSGATIDYKNPMYSFFNWHAARLETINTGNIFTWPTIAPSGIEFYNNSHVPGWQNSLLVTSLKYGIFRLKLNALGDGVDGTVCINAVDTFPILHSWRVRDIAISPTGAYIWAIIDSSGSTSGPTGGFSGGSGSTKSAGRMLRLTSNNFSTLPVYFISFSGKLTPAKTVELNWVAIIDQKHKYFEVEKSYDRNIFVPIGKVYGSPPFRLIDPYPAEGNNYYRVKAVDADGSFLYSKTINVVNNNANFTLSVYPNPVNDLLNINIKVPNSNSLRLQVTDALGHTLYNKMVNISSGNNLHQINVRSWNQGAYLIKIMNSNSETIGTQKFIKQ